MRGCTLKQFVWLYWGSEGIVGCCCGSSQALAPQRPRINSSGDLTVAQCYRTSSSHAQISFPLQLKPRQWIQNDVFSAGD